MTPIVKLPRTPGSGFAVPVIIGVLVVAGALLAPHAIAPVAGTAAVGIEPVAKPFSPALASLPLAQPREVHSIDVATAGSMTTVLAHGAGDITTRRGMPVAITGWAVDRDAHLPSSFVIAQVGRRTYVAKVNVRRPDVAVALASPVYAMSGFTLDIDTAALPLGRSTVTFYGVDASGKRRYVLHRTLTLTLTQS